jgi:ABC-2 type transport system permease protein
MLRWNKAWIVAKKDLAEFRRNKIVISTLIAMPVVFAIILPLVVLMPIQAMDIDIDDMRKSGFDIPLDATLEEAKRIMLEQSLEYFLPFFLIIPAMIPTIVASYSFVGEKLNRSLEPLLASPITDLELFIGKCIAVLIPSLIAAWAAFLVFSAITDVVLLPWLGMLVMPNLKWTIIMLLVAPLICVLSIEANVYISSRVRDVRAAEQLGALVIMPLVLIVVFLSMGIIQVSFLLVPILTIVILIFDVGLFFLATRTFHREKILTEWK